MAGNEVRPAVYRTKAGTWLALAPARLVHSNDRQTLLAQLRDNKPPRTHQDGLQAIFFAWRGNHAQAVRYCVTKSALMLVLAITR